MKISKQLGSIYIVTIMSLLSSYAAAQDVERPDLSGTYMPSPDFSRMIMFPLQGPPYTEWAQNHVNEFNRLYDSIEDQPTSFCVPPGMPASMAMPAPFPIEVIQRPQDITIFFEAYFQYRKIYMEGYDRPEPVLASKMGYSVGHWEGDTLVIVTDYLAEATLGSAISSGDGKIVERIRLEFDEAGNSTLVDDMVYSDSKAYSEDIIMRGLWQSSPSTPIMEYVCSELMYEQHLERVRNGG